MCHRVAVRAQRNQVLLRIDDLFFGIASHIDSVMYVYVSVAKLATVLFKVESADETGISVDINALLARIWILLNDR